MKKFVVVLLLALIGVIPSSIVAKQIILQGGVTQGNTKTPVPSLYIEQDGNCLTLPAFSDNIILQLIDDNDDVVYNVIVPAGITTVTLPSIYTGDYVLRLVVSSTSYYIGEITL